MTFKNLNDMNGKIDKNDLNPLGMTQNELDLK